MPVNEEAMMAADMIGFMNRSSRAYRAFNQNGYGSCEPT